MTPPGKMAEEYPGWSAVAKVAIGIVGALLTLVGTWVARASESQAKAFKDLEAAVYNGQTKAAVLEVKVDNIDTRVRIIESRLHKEK